MVSGLISLTASVASLHWLQMRAKKIFCPQILIADPLLGYLPNSKRHRAELVTYRVQRSLCIGHYRLSIKAGSEGLCRAARLRSLNGIKGFTVHEQEWYYQRLPFVTDLEMEKTEKLFHYVSSWFKQNTFYCLCSESVLFNFVFSKQIHLILWNIWCWSSVYVCTHVQL